MSTKIDITRLVERLVNQGYGGTKEKYFTEEEIEDINERIKSINRKRDDINKVLVGCCTNNGSDTGRFKLSNIRKIVNAYLKIYHKAPSALNDRYKHHSVGFNLGYFFHFFSSNLGEEVNEEEAESIDKEVGSLVRSLFPRMSVARLLTTEAYGAEKSYKEGDSVHSFDGHIERAKEYLGKRGVGTATKYKRSVNHLISALKLQKDGDGNEQIVDYLIYAVDRVLLLKNKSYIPKAAEDLFSAFDVPKSHKEGVVWKYDRFHKILTALFVYSVREQLNGVIRGRALESAAGYRPAILTEEYSPANVEKILAG